MESEFHLKKLKKRIYKGLIAVAWLTPISIISSNYRSFFKNTVQKMLISAFKLSQHHLNNFLTFEGYSSVIKGEHEISPSMK